MFCAGESGLGKSTFIYNLLSGFKIVTPGRAHIEGPTTMKQFKSDPNSLRTVMEPMEHPDSNTRLHISIQVRSWLQLQNSSDQMRNCDE